MGPMKTKNVYARESPRARNQTALLEQMCRQESQQSDKSEPGESFKGHKKQTNSCSFFVKGHANNDEAKIPDRML